MSQKEEMEGYEMTESKPRSQSFRNAVGGLEAGRACKTALKHDTIEAVL